MLCRATARREKRLSKRWLDSQSRSVKYVAEKGWRLTMERFLPARQSSRSTFSISNALSIAACSALVFSLAGCPKEPAVNTKPETSGPATAMANIEARSGSALSGTATFEQTGNKVKVVVE